MREAIISFPMFGEGFQLNPPSSISIGNFQIYFYGIIIALGLLLAVVYTSKTCHRFGMKMDAVYDYLIWAVIAAVICARLYYCLTYMDAEGEHTYLKDPASILHIRDGGLAIYGGVIGAVLALLVRSRMRKESIWPLLDIMALGLLIGQLVGRWGNFFNREAFGYETDVFCRMGLTLNGSTTYVHPTFLYESLWNFIGFLLLHFHSKRRQRYYGQYFLLYLIWYGFGRMLIEGLRSDSLWLVQDVIRISQLLSAILCAVGIVLYLLNAARLKKGLAPLVGKPLPVTAGETESGEAEAEAPAEEQDPEPETEKDAEQTSEPAAKDPEQTSEPAAEDADHKETN